MLYSIDDTVRRLGTTLADFEFALACVPERLLYELPPRAQKDSWTVAMNLAHVALYEERYAAPVLAALAAGGDGSGAITTTDESAYDEEERALSHQPIEILLARLRLGRQAQIDAVRLFADDDAFNSAMTPLWGQPPHSAGWLATKTVQHTWDHGNAIFQVALFSS